MEINIRTSQGISQAIAEKLNLKGSCISKNVWEQVIGLVEAQNQSDGKIFGQNYGHDISGSSKSNFVVNSGKITIDDNIWNRICRLMGKPEACVEIKSGPVDTDLAIKNGTIRAKAFTRITNALKNNQLGEVPPGFREALIKAYGEVDDIHAETTEADYIRSLLIQTQKNLAKTENMSEDMARRAMEYTVKICPDGELDGKACSEYSKTGAIDAWLENAGLKQVDAPPNAGVVQTIKFTQTELEGKIANVKAMLNQVLKGREFTGPTDTKITGEQLLEIINKDNGIVFENVNYGSGRADTANGQIWINLNGEYTSNSDAELMRLIIHEALHCAYKTPINTMNEEYCCESQALKLTAEIVAQEKNNSSSTFSSYQAYGRNVEDFGNDWDLLDKTVLNWLDAGYSNRPSNLSGDISILKDNSFSPNSGYTNTQDRIDIFSGDEVYVDGEKITTIGESYLESANLTGNGNSNICHLCKPASNGLFIMGWIKFDGTVDHTGGDKKLEKESKDVVIKRDGEIICKGKMYNYPD